MISSDSSSVMPHASRILIDTHCHLDMEQFDKDRDAVIMRAHENGLGALITVGAGVESSFVCIELARKYNFVYASVGVHPHDAKLFTEDIFRKIKELSVENKVVAIGETGLDYHYNNSPREKQKEAFRKHLLIARESGLPVIVHSRKAYDDTIEILKESGAKTGVLHCFSGDRKMAEQAISMGFYISVAGPVTYKKALGLKEIASIIPDDYLILETDSPYLTPEPLRGKRNEPSFLVNTASEVASLRGITLDDLARITTLNAKRLFGIGPLSEKPVIAYRIRNSLYLNITNRCSNRCSFCIKFHSDYVKGHKLRLDHEPSEEEIIQEIASPSSFSEIVFCGYGEPLYRLELVKRISRWIKDNGGFVRINTNGHANLIHKRNIIPELKGLVDSISISLDAHDEVTYRKICRPVYKYSFNEVLSFIKGARDVIPEVQVTVVEIEGVDIEKCKKIAETLGVKLRVRKLDVVG